MRVRDAQGNPVTASSPDSAALLDAAVQAHLGFRKDTGERLKAISATDPDLVIAHCLRGCFMMLFSRACGFVHRPILVLLTARWSTSTPDLAGDPYRRMAC